MRSAFSGRWAGAPAALCALVIGCGGAACARSGAAPAAVQRIPLADAMPVFEAMGDRVPAELRIPAVTTDAWDVWLSRQDAETRERLDRGDEDSLVNLMLYGTTFTRVPRTTPDALGSSRDAQRAVDARLDDLVAAIQSRSSDQRVEFARQLVGRRGVDATSRTALREFLGAARARVLSENVRYVTRLHEASRDDDAGQREAFATVYRDRGLSSDTSLRVDFALEQALRTLRDRGELTRRPINNVAIVGPGLDFVDKAQGYDFYPLQTIQPFAVADSLLRLGATARPSVTAMDISPRVLAHLSDARQQASRGDSYTLNLPLERDDATTQMDPALVDYWRRFGDQIGVSIAADVPVALAARVQARAVKVRPRVVLDVAGANVDIVVERLAAPAAGAGFDLITATNVLVYYTPFEQTLAVTNMAGMLARGGLLLTNQPVPAPAAAGLSPVLIVAVNMDRVVSDGGTHDRGDSIYVYRKV